MLSYTAKTLLAAIILCASALSQVANIDTNVKGSRWPAFGTDSGAANAYVVTTVAPLGPSLRTGSKIIFFATHANSGASTLNVDSVGVKSIKKSVSTALASGDILLNGLVEVVYDGTNFQCLTCFASSSGTVTSVTCGTGLSGGTITTSGTCALANTAVTPGSYTNTNLTVDAQGRLTAASNGSGSSGSGCSTGLPSVCAYYLNDTGTGTSLNHLVRFVNAGVNQKAVRDFGNSDPPGWASGLVGVVQSGAGTSGKAEVCFAGRCQCEFSNAATQGDFVDIGINTSTAPKCRADSTAGVNENPETHTYFAKVHTTIASAGVTDIDMLPIQAEGNALSVFGAGNIPVMVAGGQHLNITPMGLEISGGTATNVAPFMSTLTGYRVRSQSNVGQFFDIYAQYSNSGSDDSELLFDEYAGGNGTAFRFSCEACGGSKNAAHYTPAYTASVSGSVTLADTYSDTWNLTLTGNTTITYQRPRVGHVTYWNVCQDGTGGRTFAVHGNGGSNVFSPSPVVSTTASACTTWSAVTTNGNYTNPGLSMIGIAGTGGAGSVTSFSVGTWPSWLTPTVTNSTSTPQLSVAGSAQGNSSTVQLAGAGTPATDDCAKFDANHNLVSAGGSCTVGGGGGTVNSAGPRQLAYYSAAASAVSGYISPLTIDIPPSSANALDDEMNGSSIAGQWTAVNLSTSTAVESGGTLTFTPPTGNGTDNIRGYSQAVPGSTPYTVVCKLSPGFITTSSTHQKVGMFISDGTKYVTFHEHWTNGNILQLDDEKYTNTTTFSATYRSLATNTGMPSFGWQWLSIQNDGTNLVFSISRDGISYSTFDSRLKGDFLGTISTWGFFAMNVSSGGGAVNVLDYCRRTQ